MKILFIGESWHIHMIHSKDMTASHPVNTKKALTIYYPVCASKISLSTTCQRILYKPTSRRR